MAGRKIIHVLPGLAAIVFLAGGCVDSKKIKQLEGETAQLNQAILQKDAKIKTLTVQVEAKQVELNSAKKELEKVNKEFDASVVKPAPLKK